MREALKNGEEINKIPLTWFSTTDSHYLIKIASTDALVQ